MAPLGGRKSPIIRILPFTPTAVLLSHTLAILSFNSITSSSNSNSNNSNNSSSSRLMPPATRIRLFTTVARASMSLRPHHKPKPLLNTLIRSHSSTSS